MPLTAINATHGSFDVVMENITHGVYYCLRYFLSFSVCICANLKCICTNINCICLFMIITIIMTIIRVELVNHPYCNSGADQSLDRQTKICRPALWNEPIFIGRMIMMIKIIIMIIIMMPFMIFIKIPLSRSSVRSPSPLSRVPSKSPTYHR